MSNPGAKPGNPTAIAIVRHGFTRRERLLIAARDARMMRVVHAQNWDADTINAICGLCDEFKQKHGGH